MRALVLGAGGMLGHRLWRELTDRLETFAAIRRPYRDYAPLNWFDERRVIDRVDATNATDLERALRVARPDVVINAVGLVKQREDAADPVRTIAINALLPHQLAARAALAGARLIHLSTDCVFSGRRGNYSEDDIPDAVDLYGRSKLLGEVDYGGALTIRTSMVGREIGSARGLLEWFLAHRGESVRGFARARFSGLTTLELSRVIAAIATRYPTLEGVWHVAGEQISKLHLLSMVNDTFHLGSSIEADDSFVCDRTLDASRFMNATGYRPPSWSAMVAELAADPTPYDAWTESWTSNARDHSTVST
ncbi:MAG TPA: SDR family oxidoreductase [Gemmatimonadaceae bacterium]|jgi:dTDP-4-dehydrorhamnose reductase|nr:SDR family oxidoreductase [Gemmatimonadaceae bacterium]